MPQLVDKKIGELKPGDVVAKPVYTEDGSVVVNADTVLMARHIALLEKNEIYSVIVEVDEADMSESDLVSNTFSNPAIEQVLNVGDDGDPLLKTILVEAQKRLAAGEEPPMAAAS